MSLFERLKNKRYDLIEKKEQRDNSYLFDDDKDSSENKNQNKNQNKKKPNQNKKFSKNIESGRTTYNKNQKLDQEISQTRSRETLRQDQINKQYGIDGGIGDSGGSEDGLRKGSSQTSTTERPNKREVKKIMNQSIENQKKAAERAKTFRQSFGTPTGADPKTGKPFYGGSTVSGKAGPDIDLPKGRGGGIPTDKAYEKQAKRLGDREAAKKTYIDPKTYKASKEGTKAYIRKSLQMKTGSNIPVDEKEVNKIYKKSGKEYMNKINQEYGGKRSRVERETKTAYQKEIDRRAKSSKKFNGKSFDDLIKDANKNNKAISQEIKNLKTRTFVPPKTTPLVTPPKVDPITQPLTEPLKKTRTIKKIKIKAPPKTQTGTFKKIMKFAGKNRNPILKTLGYTAAGAYLLSRTGTGTGDKPKNKSLFGGGKSKIKSVKPVDIKFTLAGKGGDGYKAAGMKK